MCDDLPFDNIRSILSVLKSEPSAISCLLCLKWLGSLQIDDVDDDDDGSLEATEALDVSETEYETDVATTTGTSTKEEDADDHQSAGTAIAAGTTARRPPTLTTTSRRHRRALQEFLDADGLEAILNAMQSELTDDEDVQWIGCQALVTLLTLQQQGGGSGDVAPRMAEAEGIDGVCLAMKRYLNSNNEELQSIACSLLQTLLDPRIVSPDHGLSEDVVAAGAVSRVTEAMVRYPDSLDIQTPGCCFFADLAASTAFLGGNNNNNNQQYIIHEYHAELFGLYNNYDEAGNSSSSALMAVGDAMRQHVSDPAIHAAGCRLIRQLATRLSNASATTATSTNTTTTTTYDFSDEGGAGILLEGGERNKSDAKPAARPSKKGAKNKKKQRPRSSNDDEKDTDDDPLQLLLQADAIYHLCNALKTHGVANRDVRTNGLEALVFLALVASDAGTGTEGDDDKNNNNSILSQFVEHGVIAISIQLMQSFPKNERVQRCGCAILYLMACKLDDTGRSQIIVEGGEAVLRLAISNVSRFRSNDDNDDRNKSKRNDNKKGNNQNDDIKQEAELTLELLKVD